MTTVLIILLLAPLAGFLLNSMLGTYNSKTGQAVIGTLAVFISFCCTIYLYMHVQEPMHIQLLPWIESGTWKLPFSFLIDHLSITMLLFVTGVGTLIHLYSAGYMHDDGGHGRFFAYLNLFMFSMILLVTGSSLPVIFIGWEGVGFCSFLLIGFWFKNHTYNSAARKAFVMNRIGDMGFLIGMFLLAWHTGSLTIPDILGSVTKFSMNDPILTAATICLFIGACGKSAQLPLFTWLPDAMAGPTPVSALIHAATMVTAGVYLVARMGGVYALTPLTMDIILWVAVATAFIAATIGLKQTDIKKVLAYSTVSQLGYMFAALGVGVWSTGIFHVVTHAFFKALLFLGAGSVIHAMHGEQDIRNMGGLRKWIPITHITFLIGTLAITGVPPFAGFFSKDEILAAVHGHQFWAFVILAITSVITAIYMFRCYFLTFGGTFRGTEHQRAHVHESPWTMTVPLIILAIFSIGGGFLGLPTIFSEHHAIGNYLHPIWPQVAHHADAQFEWKLIITSIIVLVIIISFVFYRYIRKQHIPVAHPEGIEKVLDRKYYLDEIYHGIIEKPILQTSRMLFQYFDRQVLNKLVDGVGGVTRFLGLVLRTGQNGYIHFYLFSMVLGILVIIGLFLALH